jgi:pimeloyl-ACP methyl ester carboxylesterase
MVAAPMRADVAGTTGLSNSGPESTNSGTSALRHSLPRRAIISEMSQLTLHPSRRARLLHRACAAGAWLVLHPVRVPPVVTPRLAGLRYRRFRLEVDGTRLAAWHVPCAGSRRGVVLCHGHNNCRSQLMSLVRPLHEAGFHVLLFDHRTMGLSGGSHCTYGYTEHRDVLAAADWLREEAAVEQVGLVGLSMGGACVLLAAAADPRIGAVVTECAFARLEEMVEQRFYALPESWRGPIGRSIRQWCEQWAGEVIAEVDPERALRGWEPRPLLLIHGEDDRLIPVEHAHRLAAAAGETAELWLVPGANHVGCHGKAGDAYTERVVSFLRQHLL